MIGLKHHGRLGHRRPALLYVGMSTSTRERIPSTHMLNREGSTQQNFHLRYEGRCGWLKKSSSTPTREDFLLRNIAPFLPFVPTSDPSCSGLSSHSTRFYRPEPVRDGNGSILNRCLTRTATFAEAGSSLQLPTIPRSLPIHSLWRQSLGQRSNRPLQPTRRHR